MCITWKYRQARLGIDDFGHPLPLAVPVPEIRVSVSDAPIEEVIADALHERAPLLPKASATHAPQKRNWWWFG
jgi:hypothetical protein